MYGDDCVIPIDRFTMNVELAGAQVERPVFQDSGAGIETRFDEQIRAESGVRDLDHEEQITRIWMAFSIGRRGTVSKARLASCERLFSHNTIIPRQSWSCYPWL